MIALLILTTYFPRLERSARPSPTLGPHVFQTTAFSVLKVPNMSGKRQFTWQELASLNLEHNAHIAINGKVRKASRGPYYVISLLSSF